MDISFKIDSNSLKAFYSDTEAIIKSKIDFINKESFKKFSLFTPLTDHQLDSLILKDLQRINLFFTYLNM